MSERTLYGCLIENINQLVQLSKIIMRMNKN